MQTRDFDFTREGIRVRRGTVTRVAEAHWPSLPQSKVQVLLRAAGGEETIEGSHLLVAGGRWPNVVGLGLDVAGIKYDEHGIVVGAGLKTSNRRVNVGIQFVDTNAAQLLEES